MLLEKSYQKLLFSIKAEVKKAEQIVVKSKVLMCWNIGKRIDEYLSGNEYGDGIVQRLSSDLLVKKQYLYKMRNLFLLYPKLDKQKDINLNWSQYALLLSVKDETDRKFLENVVVENSLSTRDLAKEIKSLNDVKVDGKIDAKTIKKLRPVRGRLFTYNIISNPSKRKNPKKFIDCGFNVFKDLNLDGVNVGDIVVSNKVDSNYEFSAISLKSKRTINIYKAYLERVVDGDTIRVILDLGFGVYHREILRLKGVNAPEARSLEGKKSKKVLEDILSKCEFLIVKTIKIDVFGRYVADIFFSDDDKQASQEVAQEIAQEIANSGKYLNQILLDKGSVELI